MTAVDQLFAKLLALPSMPEIVQALISSLGSEGVRLEELISKVRQDQALSARVLRLANSSYYGGRRKIGAIDDAVTLIGLDALRTLVIASGLSGAFTQVPGINLERFWKKSTLSACVARRLGRSVHLNAEFAYTAALMHRIGQLLINQGMPPAGKHAHDELSAAALAEVERARIGFDHCEASAALAARWHFPAAIQNALRWYLTPLCDEACPYAAVVALAVQIGENCDAIHEDADIINQLDQRIIESLVLDQYDWQAEIALIRTAGAHDSAF